MLISNSLRWLVVVAGAAMLFAFAAACSSETIEVPGETVVVEKEVIKTVEVPGETVVKEVVKEVQVPGETVVVKEEVVKEVMVPGETVVVEKVVTETVEVPGETVTVEVVKEVMVPGETVVVEKEVVKTVEVPGQTVVVEKQVPVEVVKTVEVPVEVIRTVEVPGPERVMVKEVPAGYVTDPSTGKVVEKPRYGGTLTTGWASTLLAHVDSWWGHNFGLAEKNAVLEKPTIANWAIDRDEWAINSANTPTSGLTGALAESWETPDDTTIVLNIREGVHWHDKAPMNGRVFTADDMVYNYHRLLGLGSGFTEPSPAIGALGQVGIESITASDERTVVFKLDRPHFFALSNILDYNTLWMYPPDVIKQHGDAKDWRNLVGTGPFMLTDYVEGSSLTFEKNPNYWGFDEKYPENRLPYVDKIITLLMQEEATRLAALRSGKVGYLGYATGGGMVRTIDPLLSLAETNPEIAQWPYLSRGDFAFGVNVNKPQLDDIRVRRAMQMALDLETINRTLFHGRGDTTPHGQVGSSLKGWFIPFDEWPEELKKGYMYDPEGANMLLDEAGLRRGADGIRFKTSAILGPWNSVDYYELAAFYWREIGIDLEVQVVPAAEWLAKGAEASFELLRSGSSGAHYFGEGRVSVYYTGAPWNNAAVSDPDYDAMIDALRATSDFEEYQRLFREADLYAIGKHWMIWGPDVPQHHLSQPWVKGYNGEAHMGNHQFRALFARIWIDQELKAAMGH